MQIQEHIPLAPLTTFHIGGPARFFTHVQNIEELADALAFAKENNLKIFVLGGGSNILIPDEGFDGLVIKVELLGVEEKGNILVANAGESWGALVKRAVNKDLWGIENLSGIPGTVGGAVVQNIGAYGQALSQTLKWAEVFDTRTGEVKKLGTHDLKLGYRGSIFKEEDGHYVVLRACLELSPNGVPVTTYRDLATRFENRSPTIGEMREAVLDIRAQKFPDLAVEGTAGSFFKNPILGEAEAKKLQAEYPEMPVFAMPETSGVKVPLAWLLDHVLNVKGMRAGSARIFERQPLVIAAEKNASARDVRMLAEKIRELVREKLGIEIEPEVRVI
jgi:UDP-N-acetylmuramate dehydrogenase